MVKPFQPLVWNIPVPESLAKNAPLGNICKLLLSIYLSL